MTNDGYQFKGKAQINDAISARKAIEISTYNYLRDQLGWTDSACAHRVEMESNRIIPKTILDLQKASKWDIPGKRIIEVGSGQGGMLLELLLRKADAYGVEPGSEFYLVAQKRLLEQKMDASRLKNCGGEKLPFPDNHFDYAVTFQVLEHVENPEPIIREIHRVLKPGGRCFLSCENYFSFYEGHYRIRWFPLLPKFIGKIYLRIIGRNPEFLEKYVYYTTFLQILKICLKSGFAVNSMSNASFWQKLDFYLRNIFRPTIQFQLEKI